MLESFKDQMYLLSSVTRLSFDLVKELIWFKYLVLKVFPVSPTGFLFHVVFSRNCGLVDYPLRLAFSGERAGVYLAAISISICQLCRRSCHLDRLETAGTCHL